VLCYDQQLTDASFIASTVPAWQAECLKTHRRGSLLMVSFGSCIAAGLAIAYWISYALSFAAPNSASWRVPIVGAIIPVLMALGLVVWLPESPRYLILYVSIYVP
jgi:MFS family permease